MIDRTTLDTWSDDELEQAAETISQEKQRRYTLKTAEKQMDSLMWQYSEAVGREGGDEWVQPTGAHDSYPKGFRVTHGDKVWVSLIPGNVWEPGVSGWREYVVPESGVIPEYLPPSGAHDAYMTGDRVMYHGAAYESVIDSNIYSPSEYPQGWVEIDPDLGPGDGTSEPKEWVKPTGAHNSYSTGDQVIFEGAIYESVNDNNVYSPQENPDGWVVVSGEVVEPEPDAPVVEAVPEFVQPAGAHDAYQVGDQVLFEGAVYESVIENNVYSPVSYPAGWKAV